MKRILILICSVSIVSIPVCAMYTVRRAASTTRPVVGVSRPIPSQSEARTYRSSSTQETIKKPSAFYKYFWRPMRNSTVVQKVADTISGVLPTIETKFELDQDKADAIYKAYGLDLSGSFKLREHIGPGWVRRSLNQIGQQRGIPNFYQKVMELMEKEKYGSSQQRQSNKQEQRTGQGQQESSWFRQQQEQQRKQQEEFQKRQAEHRKQQEQNAENIAKEQKQFRERQERQRWQENKGQLYRYLNMKPTASKEQMREAYHAFMIRNHPDALSKLPQAEKVRREASAKTVNDLYDLYKNYDQQ